MRVPNMVLVAVLATHTAIAIAGEEGRIVEFEAECSSWKPFLRYGSDTGLSCQITDSGNPVDVAQGDLPWWLRAEPLSPLRPGQFLFDEFLERLVTRGADDAAAVHEERRR